MSFYFTNLANRKFADVELLHRLECKLCPLYNLNYNKFKDIKPDGFKGPDGLYVLGLGPGQEESDRNKFFVGTSGRYLKSNFTEDQIKKIRFNNVVRTRPPEDSPSFEAIEACRPSVEKDIAETKPRLIFLLGGYPLQWALQSQYPPSINAWRGHRFPLKVNGHVMWAWPVFHPAFVTRKFYLDEVFKLDIKHAYEFLERGLIPQVIDPKHALDNVQALYKLEDIQRALSGLYKEPSVSIDLETTPTRPYHAGARILTISVGTKNGAIAFPWKHSQFRWDPVAFKKLSGSFHAFLRNKKQIKIAHNAAFEQEWLIVEFNDPLIARSNWKDTMSPAYTLGFGGNVKESSRGSEKLYKGLLSLDSLCMVYFGFWVKELSNLDRANLDMEPLAKVLVYNGGDTIWDHALSEKLDADVEYQNLQSITAEHNRRVPTVVLMQWKGLHCNEETAKQHALRINDELTKLFTEVNTHPSVIEYSTKYGKFSISAPADVAYLFKYLGYKVTRLDPETKKEKISSDDEILQAIDHPLAKSILAYRGLAKLKSTYIDIFIPGNKNYIIYPDGLVHGNFTTFFTTTGRTSSEDPNLQNFPKRKNKEIRNIIIAPEGYVLVSCDYGQIEYRVLVMASKDKKLIDYVWNNRDIHAEWAYKIALRYPKRVGKQVAASWKGKNLAQLKDEDKLFASFRDIVKNAFVFAAFYGAGTHKLAMGLGIPEEVMKEFHQEFREEFSGVFTWHKEAYQAYSNNGYIESLSGRRRYAPLQAGEIINAPIQGGASDIVIDGMNRLSEYALETDQLKYQAVSIVHDDLQFYLPIDSYKKDLELIVNTMLTCQYPFINVPLTVEAAVGPNWAKMTKVGTFASNKLEEIIIE